MVYDQCSRARGDRAHDPKAEPEVPAAREPPPATVGRPQPVSVAAARAATEDTVGALRWAGGVNLRLR